MYRYRNRCSGQVVERAEPSPRFTDSGHWESVSGDDMPLYRHTSGQTVTTVEGSIEDRRLRDAKHWERESATLDVDLPMPHHSDRKADWIAYARQEGYSASELNGLTKAELIELVEGSG